MNNTLVVPDFRIDTSWFSVHGDPDWEHEVEHDVSIGIEQDKEDLSYFTYCVNYKPHTDGGQEQIQAEMKTKLKELTNGEFRLEPQ